MKRVIISLFIAFVSIVAVHAQQIAVVSSDGGTKMYQTFADAVEGAKAGSTVYLPGGGFQIGGVTVDKKLSIIGVGHKPIGESADGNTTLSGDLYFGEGSDGSSLMGCYVSGNVWIGFENSEGTPACTAHNILIKYCNVNSIQSSFNCTGTIINQNYIRNNSNFRGASAMFTNNIAHSVLDLDGNKIEYNIITSAVNVYDYGYWDRHFGFCDNCTIANNILLTDQYGCGGSCVVQGNMGYTSGSWGENYIIRPVDWEGAFVKYNNGNISTASDFHFKDAYKEYEHQVGIYAGEGFKDSGLAPVPTIVAKDISEQTDAEGKLNIKIRVKASE